MADLTLDTARPAKGQELYVPQHPAGEPTRIAGSLGEQAGNCSVANDLAASYTSIVVSSCNAARNWPLSVRSSRIAVSRDLAKG